MNPALAKKAKMEHVNFTTTVSYNISEDKLEGYRSWVCPHCGHHNDTSVNVERLRAEGILKTKKLLAICKNCLKASWLSNSTD